MTEPQTAAGRAMKTALWGAYAPGVEHDDVTVLARILAIEAEARHRTLDEVDAALRSLPCLFGEPHTHVAQDRALAAVSSLRGPIFDGEGTLIPEDEPR